MSKEYKIHYSKECYPDGCNLLFSIEFLNYKYPDGQNLQTYWFNDNHEFGDDDRVRESAVRLVNWYLSDPINRVLMIKSGYHDPAYFRYLEEFNSIIELLLV